MLRHYWLSFYRELVCHCFQLQIIQMISDFKCTFWISYSDWTIHPVKNKWCEESRDIMNRGFIVTQKILILYCWKAHGGGTWGFLNIGILRISCRLDGNRLPGMSNKNTDWWRPFLVLKHHWKNHKLLTNFCGGPDIISTAFWMQGLDASLDV